MLCRVVTPREALQKICALLKNIRMNTLGTLYLIPCRLADETTHTTLPEAISTVTAKIKTFLVEDEKSARRFLRSLDAERDIQSLSLIPLNEHSSPDKISIVCAPLLQGEDMGVISEAGCPGVADPGAEAARYAHGIGATVRPLVGPNSMLLGLMASGLTGQRWRFVGYPPRKEPERTTFLKELFATAHTLSETQIVMDAPYRTERLLADLLKAGQGDKLLCIAANLTGPDEFIRTKSVAEWRKETPKLNKSPAVFLVGGPR